MSEKLKPILWEEREKFNEIWTSYHAKYNIPYSYDERDAIFESIAFIFTEDK